MKIKIRYSTPYALDKNLAKSYNEEIKLGGCSHICFVDRDVLFLTPDFGHIIYNHVKSNPYDYLTCYTNRVNCKWQLYNSDWMNDDIKYHTQIAKLLAVKNKGKFQNFVNNQLWSGMLMVVPVKDWIALKTKSLLGVDNEIHLNAKRLNRRVLLMKDLYVYHYYRGGDSKNKKHLV